MSLSQPTASASFHGVVETTTNALRLIHAARLGVIPRICRRLNPAERETLVKSGSVFVFCVEESRICRWTDGLLWSPSRILGNFLVYHEISERTVHLGRKKLVLPHQPSRVSARSLTQLGNSFTAIAAFQAGELSTLRPNGLIKKTFSVAIKGSNLHLISYCTSTDQQSGKFKRPTTSPDIMNLPMDPRLFKGTKFRVPLPVEKAPDGTYRLV
ncbi:Gti1/Pac2 family-domain-containing protein [Mycena maculata]|uniref:Gti1/Pac2 family-domain-containing protein n=1 Tax=Mycena maculata TaxID=230809 RepID=A0AAD7H4V3_9AGAR|nr:Gti1/Pac2 family-domain-containing protein [Mycena maculata]